MNEPFIDAGIFIDYVWDLRAERDTLLAQVATLQSDANSWQSGYDKGRDDGGRHMRSEVKSLSAKVEAMRSAIADLRDTTLVALAEIAAGCSCEVTTDSLDELIDALRANP